MKTENPQNLSKQPNHKTIPKNLTIAVVGATGMVGQEFLKILKERKFPIHGIKLFASEKSAGEKITFNDKIISLEALAPGCFQGCDVAFFSAGAGISLEWGPQAVKEGAFVIDNSSAFRMDPNVPLVVPEVNPHCIPNLPGASPIIIANPNCSTIQMVVALKPLHDAFGLKSVTVSTYQSVSGAGKEAVDELKNQAKAILEHTKEPKPEVFHHPIAFNNIPQIDKFDESGFTLEELKVHNETKKIMELPQLEVSCTAVRTPTLNGHSEAVWAELERDVGRDDILKAFKDAPGLVIEDNPQKQIYPLTRNASGKDATFVGRIRRDLYNPKKWLFWVVSDNIRKGAALNGVQIAEKLFRIENS